MELLSTCKGETRLCIAVDITATSETIQTKTIAEWKSKTPDIHKRLAVFLIQA
jgi:16S rRNA (cytidine1402-2'-O)-methyltransferase